MTFTLFGKGVWPCAYPLTEAKGPHSSWEGPWYIFISLHCSRLGSFYCCEWPWHSAVCASNVSPHRKKLFLDLERLCVGEVGILFFRLLLKHTGLIFPLLGFPRRVLANGLISFPSCSVLADPVSTTTARFLSDIAPALPAGGANVQPNELIGGLNTTRLVCYALYLVGELSLLCGVWILAGILSVLCISLTRKNRCAY